MFNDNEAVLSHKGSMTSFAFQDRTIRFRTSRHLKRYLDVSQWDNGYIVCTALYDNSDTPEEDYIDLIPILDNLYIDTAEFLRPIEKVRVCYDG